jgi:hypothetical protein
MAHHAHHAHHKRRTASDFSLAVFSSELLVAQDVAGFGGPPKMLAALRLSAFAFSFSE